MEWNIASVVVAVAVLAALIYVLWIAIASWEERAEKNLVLALPLPEARITPGPQPADYERYDDFVRAAARDEARRVKDEELEARLEHERRVILNDTKVITERALEQLMPRVTKQVADSIALEVRAYRLASTDAVANLVRRSMQAEWRKVLIEVFGVNALSVQVKES